MGILLNIILAISVTLDSFIVGKSVDKKIKFTLISISFAHVALFFIGVKVGDQIGPFVSNFDHWISFVVFLFLAISSYKDLISEEPIFQLDNIFKILLTTFALSIDAFAVGASSQHEIQYLELVIIIIAVSAPVFCYLGYKLKNEMIKHSHKLLYFSEGTFFLIIGSYILYSHISGGY
ncbi:manganese efflux pump [Candidatus Pelagibacter sp.]|jgi:putative Mn2+ efflux pump MntP|nr:manganese efflux pump [Candidatus Pelagibacter sp.]MDC0394210.1 manganese efflux pump [Candidatus Pelagibacter sp.]MDC0460618.1 manganese efflux pump [Candidatus Pelagibacter sp.]MDC1170110.1 manganese efflux pump [Candidatus Pelagibacter sp.]